MFFHRDDAVAHRLSLSRDRPVEKKESPVRTWACAFEGAALMRGTGNPEGKTVDRPEAWRSAPRVALAVSMPPYTANPFPGAVILVI
jgi:hypothetical protein